MTDSYENKSQYLRARIRCYLPLGLVSSLPARLGPHDSEDKGNTIFRNVGRLQCLHTQQAFALKYVRVSSECRDKIRSGSWPSSYIPSHSFSHSHRLVCYSHSFCTCISRCVFLVCIQGCYQREVFEISRAKERAGKLNPIHFFICP